jgi:hypothetical protein
MDEVHISSSVLYKFLLSPVFLLSRPWGRYVHIQILLGLGECDPKFKVQIRCYHLLGIKQTFVYTPFESVKVRNPIPWISAGFYIVYHKDIGEF